jgi:predicted secreted hydrolase
MKRSTKLLLLLVFLAGTGYYMLQAPSLPTKSPRITIDAILASEHNLRPAALSPKKLRFPLDHGIHAESSSETWRLIGKLKTDTGKHLALEVTFVRLKLDAGQSERQSAWNAEQVFIFSWRIMAAGAKPYSDRQQSRGALGLAGYDSQNRKLWVYTRQMRFGDGNPDRFAIKLDVPDGTYPLSLEFFTSSSVAAPSSAAPIRYYALSHMDARGWVEIAGHKLSVSGQAYFDHTWGLLPASGGQLVRNNFVLQLSDGSAMVLSQSQRRDGSGQPVNSGFVIQPDSKTMTLEHDDIEILADAIWTSDESGIRYPVEWIIRTPNRSTHLTIKPWDERLETNDILVSWSGPISISGKMGDKPVTGFGHMQLTGY